MAQVLPCHIQIADWKLTLYYAKIIEYAVFQLSLSQWFVFVGTSEEYFKDFGGLMKRFNSITVISYQFYLFYWKGQIMNNHHKIISLYVVLPTKVLGFFS